VKEKWPAPFHGIIVMSDARADKNVATSTHTMNLDAEIDHAGEEDTILSAQPRPGQHTIEVIMCLFLCW
jgi:hypothetical protein